MRLSKVRHIFEAYKLLDKNWYVAEKNSMASVWEKLFLSLAPESVGGST